MICWNSPLSWRIWINTYRGPVTHKHLPQYRSQYWNQSFNAQLQRRSNWSTSTAAPTDCRLPRDKAKCWWRGTNFLSFRFWAWTAKTKLTAKYEVFTSGNQSYVSRYWKRMLEESTSVGNGPFWTKDGRAAVCKWHSLSKISSIIVGKWWSYSVSILNSLMRKMSDHCPLRVTRIRLTVNQILAPATMWRSWTSSSCDLWMPVPRSVRYGRQWCKPRSMAIRTACPISDSQLWYYLVVLVLPTSRAPECLPPWCQQDFGSFRVIGKLHFRVHRRKIKTSLIDCTISFLATGVKRVLIAIPLENNFQGAAHLSSLHDLVFSFEAHWPVLVTDKHDVRMELDEMVLLSSPPASTHFRAT